MLQTKSPVFSVGSAFSQGSIQPIFKTGAKTFTGTRMFFDALIIDPNPTSRGYLWQATLSEPNFRRVKALAGIEEALTHLQNGNRYDVLLITSEMSSETIRNFVPNAKQTDAGKEAAYVVVLKKKDQESE